MPRVYLEGKGWVVSGETGPVYCPICQGTRFLPIYTLDRQIVGNGLVMFPTITSYQCVQCQNEVPNTHN